MKKAIINFIKSIGIILLFYFVLSLAISSFNHYFNQIGAMIVAYLLGLVLLFIFYHKKITLNIHEFNIKKFLKYLIIFIIAFIISYLAKYLIVKITHYLNTNEQTNINLLKENPLQYVLLSAFIVPLSEEILWRLNVKPLFKNKWLFSVIVGLLFSFIHLTSLKTPEIYFLFPYFVSSFTLSYIYFDSDNILYSMGYHSLNNLLAIIIILIGG